MAELAGKTAPEQITLATRQQVMLDRLKSAEVAKFKPFLQQAERDLQMRLIAADIETYDAKRIQILLDAIERDMRAIFGGYTTQLTGDLIDAAVYQAQHEARNLQTVSKVPFESVIPSPEQVRTAVMTAPLAVQGYRQGALLEPWMQGWTDDSIAYVNGVIQQGYYQGKNTAEIVRSLRGTAKMRGQDGTLAQIDRANTVLVRTAVQHSAQVARETFFRANDDIVLGLEWVSTLDSRVTIQCASLDGKRFPLDSGPRPPLHPQCRSTTIAVLDPAFDILDEGATRASKGADGGEQVSAGQNYYEWLKTQPAEFQDVALGPTRGELFRKGGLSAERFAELNLGKNFEPLTLEQMKALEPVAFARAGL